MSTQPSEGNVLLDVAGAAAHLGVSEAFVRRLGLERRVRYFKVGKFVRFRPIDLDAFVEAGRCDPVQPWAHVPSTERRGTGRARAQRMTQRVSGRARPESAGAAARADTGSDACGGVRLSGAGYRCVVSLVGLGAEPLRDVGGRPPPGAAAPLA